MAGKPGLDGSDFQDTNVVSNFPFVLSMFQSQYDRAGITVGTRLALRSLS